MATMLPRPNRRARTLAALALVAAAALAPVSQAATPIPQKSPAAGSLPSFVGQPATPDPLFAPMIPRHPHEAENGRSGIHDDAYQSDTYRTPGPLGHELTVTSANLDAVCASVTFDRRGRIVTICVSPLGPTLMILDPVTLDTLASFSLPPRQASADTNIFQGFSGGGYFYLDDQDRAIVPTTNRHLLVVAETGGDGAPGLTQVADHDLNDQLAGSDAVTSALPDWSGRLWAESAHGTLITVDPATGSKKRLALGEDTENSFAVDERGAVFVISTKALYKLRAGADGTPQVVWRRAYANSGVAKPGQVNAGSGTTPTVQGDWVSFTDNADPLQVVVVRRDTGAVVCTVPVFGKGAGSDENSLIGIGRMVIVENNYGYTGPTSVENGKTTLPGVARIDIDADGRGCHRVWENDTLSVPTVVSKLSLANGLLYTYTKDESTSDAWWFTAVDVRTGRMVYQRLTGTGQGYNNNYAPVTLGPDGAAYVGALGGPIRIADRIAPPAAALRAPRLRLVVGRGHRLRPRLAIRGDTRDVVSVRYRLGRLAATGTLAPDFARRVRRSRHRRLVRATVEFTTGARVVLRRQISAG